MWREALNKIIKHGNTWLDVLCIGLTDPFLSYRAVWSQYFHHPEERNITEPDYHETNIEKEFNATIGQTYLSTFISMYYFWKLGQISNANKH